MEFTRLADVEVVETATDSDKVLIEQNPLRVSILIEQLFIYKYCRLSAGNVREHHLKGLSCCFII